MASTNELYLKELSESNGQDVFEMLQRIGSCENEFKNPVNGMTYSEYKKWLVIQKAWSKGEELPEGYVPQSIFWLYLHDTPIGVGKIRKKITDASREKGGNIGYAIDTDYRGKGYATVLLQLLIDKAREMAIDEILLTVEKKNPASKRVIEKTGGLMIRETKERWYFSF